MTSPSLLEAARRFLDREFDRVGRGMIPSDAESLAAWASSMVEADRPKMPGRPWLVSTKEHDLWEFREENDAGKVIFYLRGTEAEATAWARFFMSLRPTPSKGERAS